MLRIAIATDTKIEINKLKRLLVDNYDIKKDSEDVKDDLYVATFEIKSPWEKEIEEVFSEIHKITGIDLSKRQPGLTKNRKEVLIRRCACQVLRHRFDMNFHKISKALGYMSHASAQRCCKETLLFDAKIISLELTIRKLLKGD